jgi:hypothetical protein
MLTSLQMVYYYKCIRFLLYPIILSADVADINCLRRCAQACAGVCQTYKKLHQEVPVGFSVMALHSIFIAGLTLLYCIWAAPNEVFGISTSNGLDACSIVLYVIAERWVGARKFRDVFDVIKQAVMESIETGAEEPRRSISGLRHHVLRALRNAGSNEMECQGEFSAMVNDMAVDEVNENEIITAESDTPDLRSQGAAMNTASAEDSDFNFILPIDGMPLLDDIMFTFPDTQDGNTADESIMNIDQSGWFPKDRGQYSSTR